MAFEVEIKFRGVDPARLGAALIGLGAVPGLPVTQEDLYLSHPSRDFRATNEALRLRRVGDDNRITYKGPKLEGPTKTREEVEIPFEAGPDGLSGMLRIFEALGFRRVASVRKLRHPFHLEQDGRIVEVAVDEVEGLGTFAEVEAIAASNDDLAGAREVVQEIATRLHLTQVEPRSYLRMILESAAVPD